MAALLQCAPTALPVLHVNTHPIESYHDMHTAHAMQSNLSRNRQHWSVSWSCLEAHQCNKTRNLAQNLVETAAQEAATGRVSLCAQSMCHTELGSSANGLMLHRNCPVLQCQYKHHYCRTATVTSDALAANKPAPGASGKEHSHAPPPPVPLLALLFSSFFL